MHKRIAFLLCISPFCRVSSTTTLTFLTKLRKGKNIFKKVLTKGKDSAIIVKLSARRAVANSDESVIEN